MSFRCSFQENVTSIQVLHPEQHTEPSPGKTTWHFRTLAWHSVNIRVSLGVFFRVQIFGLANEDSSLESVVDWLADDVARALPNFPPWLCVLRFDQDLGVSNLPSSNKGYFHPKHSRQEKTRNKLNIGHVEVGTPRPPAEPPASARGRPKSFARRLLHQFQGVVVHARKG